VVGYRSVVRWLHCLPAQALPVSGLVGLPVVQQLSNAITAMRSVRDGPARPVQLRESFVVRLV